MKTILIIIGCIIVACAGTLYFAPGLFVPTYLETSVLIDKTDTFSSKPDANEILALAHLQDDKWRSTRFRIQTVSNVTYNPITKLELPSVIPLLTNPIERDKDVGVFSRKLKTQIDSINTLPVGFHSSSIYRTVMDEVNTVATLEGKQKFVIVYSDLLEHSVLFNMYDAHGKALLKGNPKQIKKTFESAVKAGKLSGVQIYFVFRPKTEKENDSFARVVAIYKDILEHAGATVSVGANLIESKTQQL